MSSVAVRSTTDSRRRGSVLWYGLKGFCSRSFWFLGCDRRCRGWLTWIRSRGAFGVAASDKGREQEASPKQSDQGTTKHWAKSLGKGRVGFKGISLMAS